MQPDLSYNTSFKKKYLALCKYKSIHCFFPISSLILSQVSEWEALLPIVEQSCSYCLRVNLANVGRGILRINLTFCFVFILLKPFFPYILNKAGTEMPTEREDGEGISENPGSSESRTHLSTAQLLGLADQGSFCLPSGQWKAEGGVPFHSCPVGGPRMNTPFLAGRRPVRKATFELCYQQLGGYGEFWFGF